MLCKTFLDQIKPSMTGVVPDTGEISPGNIKYMNKVIYKNAAETVDDIRIASPKMARLEQEVKIKIVAAVYNTATGKVEFL
jgi:carbonic anhydrase